MQRSRRQALLTRELARDRTRPQPERPRARTLRSPAVRRETNTSRGNGGDVNPVDSPHGPPVSSLSGILILFDRCALERALATGAPGSAHPSGTVEGVRVGCFPDLYAALGTNPPDQVITL